MHVVQPSVSSNEYLSEVFKQKIKLHTCLKVKCLKEKAKETKKTQFESKAKIKANNETQAKVVRKAKDHDHKGGIVEA